MGPFERSACRGHLDRGVERRIRREERHDAHQSLHGSRPGLCRWHGVHPLHWLVALHGHSPDQRLASFVQRIDSLGSPSSSLRNCQQLLSSVMPVFYFASPLFAVFPFLHQADFVSPACFSSRTNRNDRTPPGCVSRESANACVNYCAILNQFFAPFAFAPTVSKQIFRERIFTRSKYAKCEYISTRSASCSWSTVILRKQTRQNQWRRWDEA